MFTRSVILSTTFIGVLVLAACQPMPTTSKATLAVTPKGLANPSAVYCEQQGGAYEIVKAADGGQSGVCHFPDGSQCEGWAFYRGDCLPGNEQPYPSPVVDIQENQVAEIPQIISAWVGRIRTATGQFDDYIELVPQGTGELGLTGMDPALEAEIVKYRDATGSREMVFVWGHLECNVPDYGGCQIKVSKIRAGSFQPESQPITDWHGTIRCTFFNSTPDKVCTNAFVLEGFFPVHYGIWSSDPALLSQIEQLRDSGQRVRVSGQLLSGVPDINGNQIQVDLLELMEPEG